MSLVSPGVAYVAFSGYIACVNNSYVRYLAATPNGGDSVGFTAPNYLVSTGVSDGVGIYAMGLSGCLCGEGFYCSLGQCLVSPAGTYSRPWAIAPVKCPPGTAGSVVGATSFQTGCASCTTAGFKMTSLDWGSTACVAPCPAGLAWSTPDSSCIAGCQSSKNQYRESHDGGCVACPPGTFSDGGVGLGACKHCVAGTPGLQGTFYNHSASQCETCPSGTNTVFLGTPQVTQWTKLTQLTQATRVTRVTNDANACRG